MDLKAQAPVTTLARRLAAPAHVSGLAIRLARSSGAAERLPEWLLKVAVERGAAHYHPGNSSPVPRRPAQCPGAGAASRTCDRLILTPFPAMPTPASAAEAFPYDPFLSHSAKDKLVVRPLAERLRQHGLEHGRSDILHSSFCLVPFPKGFLA